MGFATMLRAFLSLCSDRKGWYGLAFYQFLQGGLSASGGRARTLCIVSRFNMYIYIYIYIYIYTSYMSDEHRSADWPGDEAREGGDPGPARPPALGRVGVGQALVRLQLLHEGVLALQQGHDALSTLVFYFSFVAFIINTQTQVSMLLLIYVF